MTRANQGYSLIELCLAIAIGAGVVGGAVAFMSQNAEFQSQSWALTEIEALRSTILESLESDLAWNNSLSASTNATALSCLNAGTSCESYAGGRSQEIPFAVYDVNNRLVVNSLSPSSGFTNNGSPCDGFSRERGNDRCPFRFHLTWSPSCRPGDCINPLVKISATLQYSPATERKPLNLERYSILNFYRGNASTPPVCQALTHNSNSKSFIVSWTAGGRNGGAGGCTLEYQRNDSSWVNLTAVNCDAAGSAAGTIALPGDHWLGGNWNRPVNVRLRRNSDGEVLCALGRLNCSARAGSSSSTPAVDEDCNGEWNNSTAGGTCSGGVNVSRLPGDAYSCPAVLARPCGNLNFARSVTFTTRLLVFSSFTCTGYAALGNILASSSDADGVIPDSGTWMYGGTTGVATVPLSTPRCSGAYPGGRYIIIANSGEWESAECHYHSVTSPGLYF